MTTLISVANEALAQIAAGTIATLTEGSIEARECNRFAPPLLIEIADWTDWSFLEARQDLAMVLNPRPAEWLYAYAPPADLARPIAIRQRDDPLTSAGNFGITAFSIGYPAQDTVPLPFLFEGGAIFTNAADAALVYSRNNIDLGTMPPLLRRAFVLELAARIALPIKKDSNIAAALSKQAMMAKGMAIEAEENKNPRHEVRYVSQAELARAGIGV